MKIFNHSSEKGFSALFIAFLSLAIIFSIVAGLSVLTLEQTRVAGNIVQSAQSYYASEAGIEDMLLRLKNNLTWSAQYNLNVGKGIASIEVSNIVGGTRTITSTGNNFSRVRKNRIVYTISTQQVSFHYGAQVGEGGLLMGNNARVRGNVYSNGSVIPAKGGDKGIIDETVIVALNGNRIDGLQVGKDAQAHNCYNSTIGGTLTYVAGGVRQDCNAGQGQREQSSEIPKKDLPISLAQIGQWKLEAEGGGTISGDYTVSGKVTQDLGPKKITGNFLIDNNATLNMIGALWVAGNLRIDNGATVKLDQSSFGAKSGVIVVDGKVKIKPGTSIKGSGEVGSYLLILSTNSEVVDTSNPAIDVDNNSDAAIFYTNQGLIVLRNRIEAREVTGYKIFLDNNAEILYEAGLEEASFSSGPGGSWEVASWQEVE